MANLKPAHSNGQPNSTGEDEDIKNSSIAFPDFSDYQNLETFQYLGEEGDALYNDYWKEVKAQ